MSGAVMVAVAAAVGNLIQGWDNAAIAGGLLYIKKEFNLQNEPLIEGLIVAMSLIGATLVTICSGAVSDWLGRRPMLIISSVLYFSGGLIMLWSPNVYILLFGRLLDGFGIGLAVTLVPVYISETSPPEIRGSLNTLPQFMGSGGMFLSYCMVFGMSLMESPSWRLMLGVLSVPSLLYFIFTIFFLPESPRWLVSKGRMVEAKHVLQRLRGIEDVAGEMTLLVEGLGVGGETTIEEYIIGPPDIEEDETIQESDKIRLYGHDHEGITLIARPVTGKSMLGRSASTASLPFMDPLVTLFSSVHEKLPDPIGKGSMLFPHFGSMFSAAGNQEKNQDWEEEFDREVEGYEPDAGNQNENENGNGNGNDSDDNLQSPLLSRQNTSSEKDAIHPASHGSFISIRYNSNLGITAEEGNSTNIGGGWQLAWKWPEEDCKDGGFKRIYLHQENSTGSNRGTLISLTGGDMTAEGASFQAAALVSHPAHYSKDLMDQNPVGPAMLHPSESAAKWSDLFEPGVKHALFVGIGLQILQQFSGISGVLYYTPQILEEAGVGVLLTDLGISSTSSSLLISNISTLLMLPCIAVAMRLMDLSGRRTLLLTTIPILILSLVILVIGGLINFGSVGNAAISTSGVVIYFCSFVMGFGPIPNILCSEIFPTRVRGICIAICALTFWICDIIVTYSLPFLLSSIGLPGVFAMYAVVCIIAWVFVFLKVPETKGMPLEVITEFFSVGAKQSELKKN